LPTRFAAGSPIGAAAGDVGAADVVVVAEAAAVEDSASEELPDEHETVPKIASAPRPAAATVLR
jgi:hypothetical protein